MIVPMCYGRRMWNWDCRYEHDIPYSWLQAEEDDCFNVSWKWNWECGYEHEILHSWFHAEGDDCFNVSWKWNWDCRYEHEIPYSWLHLEMIVSRRWRLMNIRHTFYSSFPPNIKWLSREGDAVKSQDYFVPEQETSYMNKNGNIIIMYNKYYMTYSGRVNFRWYKIIIRFRTHSLKL